MSDQRASDSDQSKRDIPSFIEPRPPLILNPFMRPRPQKRTNLLELFDEDSECEEPEWVQVYLRLKPCNVRNNLYEVKSDRCLITSVDTAPIGHGRRTQHNISKMYTFSHIFDSESSQKEIFEHVVKGNLKKLPEGHNFTLLTYGASGSGKTYTLMGTVASPGLVPRSLEYVFRVVDAAQQPLYKPVDGAAEKLSYVLQDYELQWVKRWRQVAAPLRDKYRRMSAQLRSELTQSTLDLSNRTRYYVWVSFVEIYNESIYDLLSNSDRSKATSKLRIREDPNGNVFVKGATQAFVRSGEEAYDVMVAGKHNLQVAATGVHAHSSRSHCIFTITMLTETDSGVRTSCVRLCDLAGCERARRTRNTGARMLESRAINSSLHVLERCLHMLRRKQRARLDAALVPYRESKLTRLLGAGLSGARMEAVSMVVTLNPAPEYAHETKHVLQLAAVARDIQVNQTIAESTLESSSAQDTTVESSAEVIRLRADNERLHFELVQAQTRNKELISTMEEKQQSMAMTMSEIAEEAKDMMRQYYEAQIQALHAEMEEMQEEYESKMKETSQSNLQKTTTDGTPSKVLQKKIIQLMTDIAILEEKLTAERLARARAEEEVQHLRACIEERDEKAEASSTEDNDVMLCDSDSEEEHNEDPCNESLEPTFKKEDINRSRMLQRSLINDSMNVSHNDKIENDGDHNETITENSVVEKSHHTLQENDETDDTDRDSTFTGDNEDDKCNVASDDVVSTTDKSVITKNASERGTYFVKDGNIINITKENTISGNFNILRGTYFVTDTHDNSSPSKARADVTSGNRSIDSGKSDSGTETIFETENPGTVKKMQVKPSKSTFESDISLAQFEQLEQDANSKECKLEKNGDSKVKVSEMFTDIKILTEKRTYFDDTDKNIKNILYSSKMESENKLIKESKSYFDNININSTKKTEVIEKCILNEDRSPSIVKDEGTKDFEPNKIKKMLGQSFTSQPDSISSVHNVNKILNKKHTSVDLFDSPITFKTTETKSELEKKERRHLAEFLFDAEKKSDNLSVTVTTHSKAHSTSKNESIQLSQQCNIESKNNNAIPDEKAKNTHEISQDFKIIMSTEETKCYNTSDDKNTARENKDESNKIKQQQISFQESVTKGKCHKTEEMAKETSKVSKSINDHNVVDTIAKSIDEINLHHNTDLKALNVNQTSTNEVLMNASVFSDNNTVHTELTTSRVNNTVEDFETIYKDITAPRATEFDLLINQELSTTQITDTNNEPPKEASKYNLSHKFDVSLDKKEMQPEKEQLKEEVLLESRAKSEKKPKRNLRLRKRRNPDDDIISNETDAQQLKDILQKEFSDVILDIPVPKKDIKDIPSPEKGEEENLPPTNEMQSCPSKSVTRSRRKLFTPRAEPLEESIGSTEETNERIRVPRPSYHRPRARRKL